MTLRDYEIIITVNRQVDYGPLATLTIDHPRTSSSSQALVRRSKRESSRKLGAVEHT